MRNEKETGSMGPRVLSTEELEDDHHAFEADDPPLIQRQVPLAGLVARERFVCLEHQRRRKPIDVETALVYLLMALSVAMFGIFFFGIL